ncbi:MAG: universal stress protein [Planctomycetales bacterium]|nr:universal stress protein [Planctomycetales bacterium]
MKVIAGIDGTERGDNAIVYACQLLSPGVDEVQFYYSPPHVLPFARLEPETMALAKESLVKAIFTKAAERLPDGLKPGTDSTIVGEKRAWDGILAAADDISAELIVVGAHSSTRRLQLFLGGTARKVAYNSNVPVLIVREKQEPIADSLRVLVLCDDEKDWRRAAKSLEKFTLPADSRVTLFHVVETLSDEDVAQFTHAAKESVPNSESLIKDYTSHVEAQRASSHQRMQQNREELPEIVQQAESKVVQGHVIDEVVREVRDAHIDLVVVGARRHNSVGRFLGSTTEALLTQCPCSLLIVHEPPG